MHSALASADLPFRTQPLSPALGVEVLDIDLANAAVDAQLPRVVDLFNNAGVVALRDQTLTPERLIAFSRHFGDLEPHTDPEHLLPGHCEIMLIGNVEIDGGVRAFYHSAREEWHTDLIQTRTPNAATVLYAIESPAEGAETLFADAQRAFEALPEAERAELSGLRGVYDIETFDAAMRAQDPERPALTQEKIQRHPPVSHPLVRTHPVTGARSLYFAPDIISRFEGMTREASLVLARRLLEHVTHPEFVYSHKWRDGDVVVWNNRRTLHTATPFDGQRYRRLLWRTVIAGQVPR